LGGLFGSAGSGLATTGSLFNIANGLRSGTPTGYAQSALGAAGLANKAGAFGGAGSQVGGALGVAGGALGIYNGIRQGGVQGYGQAAVGGLGAASSIASLAGNSGLAGNLAQGAGALAIPLSLYSEVKGWQSGATGSDALAGASTGAAIGTAILPGFGTAVGALLGGAAGAISSAFGNGKVDPENQNFNQYTQAFNSAPASQQGQIAGSLQNPYLPLAGYFDLRSNQLKGQNPIYDKYGRMGEGAFTNDLINQVKQGQAKGVTDPTQMWNTVVQPWINSMGTWQDSNKSAMTALMQNMTSQVMSGSYQQNFKAIGGDTPFASSTPSAVGNISYAAGGGSNRLTKRM
jgi:hypothetical protein